VAGRRSMGSMVCSRVPSDHDAQPPCLSSRHSHWAGEAQSRCCGMTGWLRLIGGSRLE
jgi:hypothetical protein